MSEITLEGEEMGEGVRKCISADYFKMIESNKEFVMLMREIEQVKVNGLIQMVDSINSKYEHYEKVINELMYLKDFSEDVIFESYKAEIRKDHNK